MYHQESNNLFLVTDEGVLVIDTRQRPKRAEELLATIRKYTDKPIKWVVNTHAHGDHMSRDDIIKNVKFENYKDVRNYYRMNLFISSYYHFLTTGRPQNAYP